MAKKFEDLEKELQKQLQAEAVRRGIDPAQLKGAEVHIEQKPDNTVKVKWGDVEVSVPGPSQAAVDSWFSQYGGVLVGALIVLAGVAAGAAVAVAAGNNGEDS